MELRQYLALFLKWFWLITVGTILAAATAYLVSERMDPVYRATTTLYVSPASNALLTDYTSILTSERLAKTYGELIKKRPVMEQAIARLNLDMTSDGMASMITVRPIRDTQLLEIAVESADPALAKAIANTVPDVFIQQTDALQTGRFASSKQNLLQQLIVIQTDIDSTAAALDAARASSTLPAEGRQAEIARLESVLATYRTSYVSILKSYEDLRVSEARSTDSIIVAEPAVLPTRPVRPNKATNTLLAAVVGAMLAVGTAFLIEYLDDTIKSPEDVQRALNISTLGMIARIHPLVKPGDALIAAAHPKSSIAEAYRVLRTNIQFAALGNPATSLLVTSSGPQEGKTTTVANLGVVMAQAGMRTLVVDTDLRRPNLHKLFAVPNRRGLTTLLLADAPDVVGEAQVTSVPNLSVLPTGPQPPNPAELLASKKMDALIDDMKRCYEAVLFDSPPVLAVADAAILAAKIHEVVLVVEPGRTRSDAARRATEALANTGAKFLGVVFNRLTLRRSGYGYYYYYYSYSSDGDQRQDKRPRRGVKAWLRRATRALRHHGEPGKTDQATAGSQKQHEPEGESAHDSQSRRNA